jgi:hypothetical protein
MPSLPAEAGNPVNTIAGVKRDVKTALLRSTGSPAFAGDDGEEAEMKT